MFEHRSRPILPPHRFVLRLARTAAVAGFVLFSALMLGMSGYRYLNDEPWVDAFADASMILSGMGPLTPLKCTTAKLFAGSYALFSGLVFLSASTIMVAPVLHRILHVVHAEYEEAARDSSEGTSKRNVKRK